MISIMVLLLHPSYTLIRSSDNSNHLHTALELALLLLIQVPSPVAGSSFLNTEHFTVPKTNRMTTSMDTHVSPAFLTSLSPEDVWVADGSQPCWYLSTQCWSTLEKTLAYHNHAFSMVHFKWSFTTQPELFLEALKSNLDMVRLMPSLVPSATYKAGLGILR